MMWDETKYAVHGRLKSDGKWHLLAPEVEYTVKEYKFLWIFPCKFTNRRIFSPLNDRLKARAIADLYLESKLYQDVLILQDNGGDEHGNSFCDTCIYENGYWVNRIVHSPHVLSYGGW